jgi:hypothetical protein
MSKPQYEVVSPLGDTADSRDSVKKAIAAPPLGSLKGKKLGLVWTVFSNGDLVLRAFRDHLSKRFPDVEFVEMPPGRGLQWGDHPDHTIGALAREMAIDGAIVTAGC